MPHPIVKNDDGTASWTHQEGDTYVVTGVDVHGRRMRAKTYKLWMHARCVNLYRGTYWLVRNGKRYRIMEAWN